MRRSQKFGPSSTYNLTLLSQVKKRVEDGANFCGLLRISELYSGVDSGGAGSAKAPPEFGGSEKGQSLISD